MKITIEGDSELNGTVEFPYKYFEEVYIIKRAERKLFSSSKPKLSVYNGYITGIEYGFFADCSAEGGKPFVQAVVLVPFLETEVLCPLYEIYKSKEKVIQSCAKKNMEEMSVDKALKDVEVFIKNI